MSPQQQLRALGVALHSQLQHARTAAYLTLYSLRPKLAQAALAERQALSEGSADASRAQPERNRPAAALAAAYVLAPVLALIVWWSLTPVLGSRALAGAVAALVLVSPPLLRLAQGAAGRAWLAVASLLAHLALGAAGGAFLARAIALRACAAQGADDCGLMVLGWLLAGAVLGGLLGYGAHGVRQVRLVARTSAEPATT